MSDFKPIFNNNPGIMFLIEKKTGIIYDANRAAIKFYGFSLKEFAGKHSSMLSLLNREEFDTAFLHLARPRTFNTKTKLKDNTIRDIRTSNSVITLDGKKLILLIIHDITENIKNKRFRDFTTAVNDLVLNAKNASEILEKICHIAVEKVGFVFSTVTFVNEQEGHLSPVSYAGEEKGYLKKLRLKTNDKTANGKGPGGIAFQTGKYCYCNNIANDPIMLPWRNEALKRGYRSVIAIPIKLQEKVKYIFGIYAPHSNYFDAEEVALLERIAENISFALTNLENIEKRQKSEKTEKYLREILQESFVYIGLSDVDHNIIFWNLAMINFFGEKIYKHGKFSLNELYTPNGLKAREKAMVALTSGKTWTGESEVIGQNGEIMPVLLTLTRHEIEGVHLISFTATDISATKRANDRLIELVEVVENSTAYISISDAERRLSYANKAMRNILEIGEDEEINKYCVMDFRQKDSPKMAEINSFILKNLKWTGEDLLISKSGKKIPVAQVIVGRQDENGNIISRSITAIDISKIKEAQNQVHELFKIIEGTPAFVITTDLNLNLTYANPSFKKAMEFKSGEHIKNISLNEFIKLENEKPQKRILDAIFKSGSWSGESSYKSRSGEEIPVWEVVMVGNDEEGNPVNVSITAIDISLAKEIEKQKSINKLKSDFVSFASHEIRTPLTAINASAELIKLNLKRIDHERISSINHYLDNITGEVERLADMVNEILTLEKIESGKLRLNIKEVVLENSLQLILNKFYMANRDDRKVIVKIEGKPESLLTDELYLGHIIENLISNAFKYSKGKQAPEVLIKYKKSEIEVTVIDFGIGIPKQEQNNLFVISFYRASNSIGIPGTGIGLNIVKHFIDTLGGNISLKSEPGKFTKVTVRIPKAIGNKL